MERNDKKIILLGLGVTGYDVLETLRKFSSKIIIVDDNIDEETALNLNSDGFYCMGSIEMVNSECNVSIIIKSPGIKYDHPVIQKYQNAKIINDIEMAYILTAKTPTKIVAITGTNGKTSTTTFVTELLNNAGYRAFSCGNIGVSPLRILREEENIDFLVMELSSFQLKAVDRFMPDFAFILNIEPDHLDYHEDLQEYIDCKFKIAARGTKSGYFFINEDIRYNTNNLTLLKNDFEFEENLRPYLSGLNIENVKLAFQLAKVIGISYDVFIDTLKNKYKGLSHRCEFVRVKDNVTYINDSKATNVAAASFALTQYNDIILIVGGYDKKEDLSLLKPYLYNVKACISYGANKEQFRFIDNVVEKDNLKEALIYASDLATSGDTVLFSPASASFDQYKNYEQRGEHFKKLVGEL